MAWAMANPDGGCFSLTVWNQSLCPALDALLVQVESAPAGLGAQLIQAAPGE